MQTQIEFFNSSDEKKSERILFLFRRILSEIRTLSLPGKVDTINFIREELHNCSPFSKEPVDFIKWVRNDCVTANDYNPNYVAPPEMKLLEHSIENDGYTQPIVTWENGDLYEVVDGFHRHRVGKESKNVNNRLLGYLPVTIINKDRQDRGDRISATIRHNRARGKHQVEKMSDIVIELKRRNWKDERIAKELGMEQDEILRLCQITGLAELFSNKDFSQAWDIEGEITESDFIEITDDVTTYGDTSNYRTVNSNDNERIFHTYDQWECYKAGFYATKKDGMTKEDCELAYRDFLSDQNRFMDGLNGVITNWIKSCQHYLTNKAMNRIAWLGQAAACFSIGIPSCFRGGYHLLSQKEQENADNIALAYLNKWLEANNMPIVSLFEARGYDRQSDIY